MLGSNPQRNLPLVLLVDSTKTLQQEVSNALEQEGYCVAQAASGEQCLEACQQLQPELVLIAPQLSDLDGFSCCTNLQNLLGDHCPSIMMVTDLGDHTAVELAFAAGATDYVTRPIHWLALRQRLLHLMQAKRATRELQRQMEQEHRLREKLQVAEQKLEYLSCIDRLTEITSRRCFDEHLHREWRRAVRERKPLSLILGDVDFFKAYNKIYGTKAGDECLRRLACAIRQAARRPADMVARYGGEEFAVLLPNTPARGGVRVAEAMRSQVQALGIAHVDSQVSQLVTLSLGVASIIPSAQSSTNMLIAEAEDALYRAKLGLRDRIVFHLGDLSVNPTQFSSSTPLIWEGNMAEFYETS